MRAARSLAARVIHWQRQHGRRGLPWQSTRDPYRVWLSEVMLQQTQVSTVLAYYARFLGRFPDVYSLAAAHLDEVLALWSGLGYYSRARNLHRCAQTVVQERGGRFPEGAAELARLPGIGRSTAAAIAAFCFGERVAILDGNVRRVLARALRFEGDLAKAADLDRLWQQAEALLPQRDIEVYTQGLMDLGATVCHRTRPDCDACPLSDICLARAAGQQAAYPVKSRKLRRGARSSALLWLQWRQEVWLIQRPASGVWASLWSLPAWDDPQTLADLVSGWPGQGEVLPAIDHALTHFDWHLQPLRWTLPPRCSGARRAAIVSAWAQEGSWHPLAVLDSLGMPAPIKRLLQSA